MGKTKFLSWQVIRPLEVSLSMSILVSGQITSALDIIANWPLGNKIVRFLYVRELARKSNNQTWVIRSTYSSRKRRDFHV